MPADEPIFVVRLTPERMEQIAQLVEETLKLVQDRTVGPEEALIVLDAAMRQLASTHDLQIVAPLSTCPGDDEDSKFSN